MIKTDRRDVRERRRRQENREAILHAAEAVILRKGLTAASMDDVAAEADFSKATLYRYFKSKAELLFEILLHFLEDMDAGLAEIRARGGSCRDRLRESILYTFRFQAQKENLSRVFMMDRSFLKLMQVFSADESNLSQEAERRFVRKIRDKRRRMMENVGLLLKEGEAVGEFKSMDVSATVLFLSAVVQGYFHEKFWLGMKPNVDKDVYLLERLIWQGIGNPENRRKE